MTTTLFEHVGGQTFFNELVDRFYDGVETEPPLRAMYPEDLEPVSYTHLTLPTTPYV